jgi:hypothetical protein
LLCWSILFRSVENLTYLTLMSLCSHWKDFFNFVVCNVGDESANTLDIPDNEVPNMIATWIFMKCDIPDAEKQKRMDCQGRTFSTALRMRASISFHYNQIGRAGNWSQMVDGSWSGNPSLSSYVSRYMLSHQRRKVSSFVNPLTSLFQRLFVLPRLL